ncbi:hypothetical protein [Phyllobacterium sp. OV277]|uniref:hypothetical protein n=1 Tax=Phyllobacterium sp. OV277 TaxID=1882772 RepID=UPI00088D33BF|nr:hypothetical protein [Phyllobacterium sp. OV277]SDP76170.1 Uncharacterized membrane protein [Phyllobacterium sp. OV277]
MQTEEALIQPPAQYPKSLVPSNYVVLLVGMVMFPFAIYGLFAAKGRRLSATGWEKSHFEFLYRTSVVSTIGVIVGMLLAAIIMYHFSGNSELDHAYIRIWFARLGQVYYLLGAWAVIRNIRGIYFAGGRRPIANPETYWVWPSHS